MKNEYVPDALRVYRTTVAKPAKAGRSLPLVGYVGSYTDPWYGDVEIVQAEGGLRVDFKSTPHMAGRLEHWQYDTFVPHFDKRTSSPPM